MVSLALDLRLNVRFEFLMLVGDGLQLGVNVVVLLYPRLGGRSFPSTLQIAIEVAEFFQETAPGEITRLPLSNIQRFQGNLEAVIVAEWDFSIADSDKHESRELSPKRIVGLCNGFANFANFH